MNIKIKIFSSALLFALFLPTIHNVFAQTPDELLDDYTYYQKYKLYIPYAKKLQYQGYLKYAKNKKYGFKSVSEKNKFKTTYDNYNLYLADPVSNAQFKNLKTQYSRYKTYLSKLAPYEQYKNGKKYKKFNDKKYNKGKAYGGPEYKAGYDRYVAAQALAKGTVGEADLPSGILMGAARLHSELGPEISVGLAEYSRTDLTNNAMSVHAISATTGNPLAYVIKNSAGTVLATVAADAAVLTTKVKYAGSKTFQIYNSITSQTIAGPDVVFEAADPAQADDIVFDFNRPSTNFDKYRGKLKLHYFENPDPDISDTIWAVNTLPLEQYVWGMGEMTGTGPMEHSKVMTTVFRTYGYWKLKFSTKYAPQGFTVNATPGNQLYYGYDWETSYPNIKKAASATQGNLVMYLANSTNEIALTPYSSWTDGKTRSFKERWGSSDYPWCKSVKDPYGKNSTMTTQELLDAGNHMVGLSAHGSLKLADTKYNKTWQEILKYYFTGINLRKVY